MKILPEREYTLSGKEGWNNHIWGVVNMDDKSNHSVTEEEG